MSERCNCCGVVVIYRDDGSCPSCQCSPAERAEAAKTGKSLRAKRPRKKMQAIDTILVIVGVVLANYAFYRFVRWMDPPRRRITIEELERAATQRAETRFRPEAPRD